MPRGPACWRQQLPLRRPRADPDARVDSDTAVGPGEHRVQVVRAWRERPDTVLASIAPDVAEAGLDDPGDLDEPTALGDLAVPLAPDPRPEAARIDRVILSHG